ncbi:hemerythrin domain-containing protein [Flavivirga sp. 57AJ16]|uniref:hemerythrin domain-containing protein n=1 Tax=Flavivirga sp. 57AJ16 TaxID=3025307 RepID=UPI002366744D|nr:hemerythrin domain-containing protein [Flavivirga sp. 57AJ16]MDD7888029.1 hemerythrin domain-containing protein [Flavivirga sp. 57AJ16]
MKPQKRHKALQPLSREHHHGLLLAWKIRAGLDKNVSPNQMQDYALWFYKTHLIPHFDIEESHVFNILGNDHRLIKKALDEHKQIIELFQELEIKPDTIILNTIANTLDNHIRFEERVLFPKIQNVATEEQYNAIERVHHSVVFVDNYKDEFWK